jgi:hypothetical protein
VVVSQLLLAARTTVTSGIAVHEATMFLHQWFPPSAMVVRDATTIMCRYAVVRLVLELQPDDVCL